MIKRDSWGSGSEGLLFQQTPADMEVVLFLSFFRLFICNISFNSENRPTDLQVSVCGCV